MTTTETGERRRFSRIGFDGLATLTQGESSYPAQVLDISIKGVLIRVNQPDEVSHSPASLYIELADGLCIGMDIRLVHRHDEYLGFHCESIDVESAAHLRRMMELNLNMPDAADRVLDEMLANPNKCQ